MKNTLRKSFPIIIVACMMVFMILPTTAKAAAQTNTYETYNYETDFVSNTQGPIWYHEYIKNGVVSQFTEWHPEWNCWAYGNATVGLDGSKGLIAAIPGTDAAMTWVAPKTGTVELDIAYPATARVPQNNTTIGFRILKNNKQVYPVTGVWLMENGTATSMPSPYVLTVEQGDRISFTSYATSSRPNDGSVWIDPMVKYVPDRPKYEITVIGGTAKPVAAVEGDTITITSLVPEGKEFLQWTSVDGVVFADEDSATTTFTMLEKPVTVTAVFINSFYNYVTDFKSNSQGPIWYHEYIKDGVTSQFTEWHPEWNCWTFGNATAGLDGDKGLIAAVPGTDSLMTFVAPKSGTIELNIASPAVARVPVNNTTIGFRILKNNTQVYPSTGEWLMQDGAATPMPSAYALTVSKNDRVSFVSYSTNKNPQDGSVWFNPTVEYIPEIDYPANTTFYVDSVAGNDYADGITKDTPWKTLEKINALTLKPGDRVLLKAGSVFESQGLAPRGNGSAEEPIIIDMYNGDIIGKEAGPMPHIKANGVPIATFNIYEPLNCAYAVHIKNMSHVKVNNLEITNAASVRKLAVGAVVEASGIGVMRDVHIDGLNVHDVFGTLNEKDGPNGGIYFVTSASPTGEEATRFDDISVQNCSVTDVSRSGIAVGISHSWAQWNDQGGRIPQEVLSKYGQTNVLIRNNYVKNAGGDAIVPQFCISPLVEYNISDGACSNSPIFSAYNAGVWGWRCEDAVFQYNEVFNTVVNGDGTAFDCDYNRGTVYQYNYSHDNGGGFMLICQVEALESVIRYNISQNDRRDIFLTSNPNSAEIYNNTFYIGAGLNTGIDSYNGRATLKNNIFYNAGSQKNPNWGNLFTYDNNIFYGFNTTPNDPHKIVADPLFVDPGKGGSGVKGNSAIDTLDGYNLQPNSPALNRGIVIPNNGGKDYAGNPIGALPDIGALERQE